MISGEGIRHLFVNSTLFFNYTFIFVIQSLTHVIYLCSQYLKYSLIFGMISVTFREDRIMTGKKDSQQINTVACSSLKSKLFVDIIGHVLNCDPQHLQNKKSKVCTIVQTKIRWQVTRHLNRVCTVLQCFNQFVTLKLPTQFTHIAQVKQSV